MIYEPSDEVKKILQQQGKKNVELTPARAMLLYALFQFEKAGEPACVFVANKLAYFLQEGGEKLRLKFVPFTYGPYAQAIDKVLYNLNGKYLTGIEQMKVKAFEPLKLNYERYDEVQDYIKRNLTDEQHTRLKNLFELIDGFESSLALEVLSSIHYLLTQEPKLNADQLLKKIQSWNERKKLLIDKDHIDAALKRLQDYGSRLNYN